MTILLLGAFAALGCGYSKPGDPSANSWYQWKSLYREDVKSVAVPIFKNKSYDRGVEFSLSKAIVNQVETRTPYKVMPRERADSILEGEIVSVSRQTLSSDPTADIPQEQLYVVRINFVWKDLRSGQILCERRNFEQTATFYPTLAEDQFVGSQQNCEKLALGIVQENASKLVNAARVVRWKCRPRLPYDVRPARLVSAPLFSRGNHSNVRTTPRSPASDTKERPIHTAASDEVWPRHLRVGAVHPAGRDAVCFAQEQSGWRSGCGVERFSSAAHQTTTSKRCNWRPMRLRANLPAPRPPLAT